MGKGGSKLKGGGAGHNKENTAGLRLGSTPSHGNPESTSALNTELNNVARNSDDTAKARALVAAGADLASTNGHPWHHTPLHQASYHGRFQMAKTLVELGAPLTLHSNPCGRGKHGTPLELARGGGHHKIAQMLEAAMTNGGGAAKGAATANGAGGKWVVLKDKDMCGQGDVDIVGNWKAEGKSIADLRAMAEERGYMAFSIDPSGRHFKHCAFKRFGFQLLPEHCTPSPGYTNEIHILVPSTHASGNGGGGGVGKKLPGGALDGHYFSFKTGGNPKHVVDRFEARQVGERVTFYRNGPVGSTTLVHSASAQPCESYSIVGNALTGPVSGTVQPNGDIVYSHGYTSRKECAPSSEGKGKGKAAAAPPGKGTWQQFNNIDMCGQGDVEILHNWKSHYTIDQLKRIVEDKGYSAFTVSNGKPSFGHAALKKFPFVLTKAHCKPITTCCRHPCTIYIYTPSADEICQEAEREPVPSVTLSGFRGYNSRLNGLYSENHGETLNGRPVFKHMHYEGVGAGHDWCRLYYAHGAWRIGHFAWVHGDNMNAVAYCNSGAYHPSGLEGQWYEHKGTGAGQDYGKQPSQFKPAGHIVTSGEAPAGGSGAPPAAGGKVAPPPPVEAVVVMGTCVDGAAQSVPMGTVLDGSVPMASAVAATPVLEMPPLIEIVELIKRELGVGGNVAEAIAAGCEQLCVSTEGKSLSEQAKECWMLLRGGRL